jgi:tetratricopeptide (TPR) repeat protein
MDLLKTLPRLDPSEIVFLCGAGVSYDPPARLPTVNRFVFDALKACGAARQVSAAVKGQIETEKVIPRFEVLIDEIRKLRDPRLKMGEVFDSKAFNKNHFFLAEMLLRGASVLTTNFDNCIENALGGRPVPRVVFADKDLAVAPPYHGVLIKVHGSNPLGRTRVRPSLVISIKALASTAQGFARFPDWRSYLRSFLRGKVIVVLGYSGSDEFDVRPVVAESRPKHILWLDFKGDRPTPVKRPAADNPRVEMFTKGVPLTYYQGRLDLVLEALASRLSLSLKGSRNVKQALGVKDYVRSVFPSIRRKEELINAILLNYALYDLVVSRKLRGTSSEIIIQKMKALYRLGRAPEVRALFAENERRFKSAAHRAQALYFQASALYQMSEFRRAISVARRQLSLVKRQGDGAATIYALNNLGSMYYAAGEYTKAKECYEESLRRHDRDASIEGQATAWWGLGVIAQASEDHAKGYEYYRKAYQVYVELGNKYNLVYTTLNIGVALTMLGRYGEAERRLKEAEASFRNPYTPQGLIFVLNAWPSFTISGDGSNGLLPPLRRL